MVASAEIIKKVYFPRMALPLAAALAALLDFLLAMGVLLGVMVVTGTPFSGNIVWLPLFIALGWGTMLGLSLGFGGINVIFRDIRHIIPFMTQMLMWLSPVAYPLETVPADWRDLYLCNPLAQAINGARWALLDVGTPPDTTTLVAGGVMLVLLLGGAVVFRRMERLFADIA